MTHQHKEAFALMWYACPCGHRERVWNSRNGVTPFGGVACPSCGGKGLERRGLSHTDWQLDEPSPKHNLNDGQLFFRDGTPEEAVAIIKRRIDKFCASGRAIPGDVAESLLENARNTEGEWNKGWPMSARWVGDKLA